MDFASFKTYLFIRTYFQKRHDSTGYGHFTQEPTVIKPTINHFGLMYVEVYIFLNRLVLLFRREMNWS